MFQAQILVQRWLSEYGTYMVVHIDSASVCDPMAFSNSLICQSFVHVGSSLSVIEIAGLGSLFEL